MSGDCGNVVKVTGLSVLTTMSETARKAPDQAMSWVLHRIYSWLDFFQWRDMSFMVSEISSNLIDCLFNRLLRLTTKNLRITGPLWRKSTSHRWTLSSYQIMGPLFVLMVTKKTEDLIFDTENIPRQPSLRELWRYQENVKCAFHRRGI